jgi:hypothetical protein
MSCDLNCDPVFFDGLDEFLSFVELYRHVASLGSEDAFGRFDLAEVLQRQL